MVGLEKEKKQQESCPETGGSSGTEALNYRGIWASFGVNSALGGGKARQENEGGFLTPALQGGWGPGTVCSGMAAARRVLGVPGAFVGDLGRI